MSTDWDVWCVPCDEPVTRFCDANHMDKECAGLIGDRASIEAFAELKFEQAVFEATLNGSGRSQWSFDSKEFLKHRGHALKPRDEYGGWSDECYEYVICAGANCGHGHRCVLKDGHEGPHE